jgi:mono/diheme cytochrome c family protein
VAGCGADDAAPTPQLQATTDGSGAAGISPQGEAATGGPADADVDVDDLVRRGERIYKVNCIACHHRDPTQDGGLGPAIAGASFELLEARVLRAEYPPGHTPIQDTRLMVPLAHLEPEIAALTAFLDQVVAK